MNTKRERWGTNIGRELRQILRQARLVWRLVPGSHKRTFGSAALVMAFVSACNTAMPLLLGRLVDRVKGGTEADLPAAALYRVAASYLVLIAAAYLLREGLNVLRRFLIENSCTRLEKVLTVRLVAHLMKIDLAALTHKKIGALQGRISRSVVGFVRFIRLTFLDFLPPLATGLFALAAAVAKEPLLALVMAGVVPVSLLLTVRQLVSQKAVRLKLKRSREVMDGTVVELRGGIEYVRAAHTQDYEVRRVAEAAESRRARELRHHFQMSLFGCAKALNVGFFHVAVVALAIFLAIRGTISLGDNAEAGRMGGADIVSTKRSRPCPAATRRRSRSAARTSPEGSGNAWPWPAFFPRTRPSSSWTRALRRSIRSASAACRGRSTPPEPTGRSSLSPTDCPPAWTPTASWFLIGAGSPRRERMRN
jgi:ATP-binding cassette subfamily B protein